MTQKRSTVAIFGAGATRGAFAERQPPPPVDADFFDIAGQLRGRGTNKLATQVLNDVWTLYGRVHGVSLERYYRDVETRRRIQEFAKAAHQQMQWGARKQLLDELIRRVFLHTTCDEKASTFKPNLSKMHSALLDHLGPGDTIITFNYDLVIEESFAKGDLWNPVNGYGLRVHGKTHRWCSNWLQERGIDPRDKTPKSQIRLLKMHGSLNWDPYTPNGISLKHKPYWVRSQKGTAVPSRVEIVPPSWDKHIHRKPYSTLWRDARLALDKAATIVLIGYSLPETDLLAYALFAEVARSRAAGKNYIREIHIAEPAKDIRDKLIELFNPALGAKGRVYQYYDLRELCVRYLGFNPVDPGRKQGAG